MHFRFVQTYRAHLIVEVLASASLLLIFFNSDVIGELVANVPDDILSVVCKYRADCQNRNGEDYDDL